MRRLITVISVAVMVAFIVFSTGNLRLMSSSSGAPTAKTGSPSDGNTCLQCHGSNPGVPNGGEAIELTGLPAGGYVPGTTYDLTLSASGSSNNMFGFEISPQDWVGNMQGSWIMGTNTWINTTNWLTHNHAGTAGSSGGASWDFQWMAPSNGTGDVNFYYTVLFADGMNLFEGDVMLQDSVVLLENSSVGIDVGDEMDIVVSTLIGKKAVVIQSVGFTSDISVQITNLNGREVFAGSVNNGQEIIDLSAAAGGIYIVNVDGSNKSVRKKILLLE